MFENFRDRFLNYYNNELRYLRNAGSLFAKQHPKIARRLDIGEKESPDPHTERLLESFAFLSARLTQQIEERFPEIAEGLLSVLYPSLVNPVPSMAIAQFQTDHNRAKLTTSYTIERGSEVFTYADQGSLCRFQTVYPVTLWPLELTTAEFVSKDFYPLPNLPCGWLLKLTLESQGTPLHELAMDSLSFHIRGERTLSLSLYESLFSEASPPVFMTEDGKSIHELPPLSLVPIGFERDEISLPLSETATHAHLLLQEYFHFPEKFLFFRINNLSPLKPISKTNTISLLIPVNIPNDSTRMNITANNFLLGCTPIVNLFPKVTEPQRLSKRKNQQRLVPDQRRDRTTEIYQILNVFSIQEGEDNPQEFSPYFSCDHRNLDAVYWVAKRVSASLRDVPGSDIDLSFVDLNFNPCLPATRIIYAKTLCTNRFLAEQLPQGASLQREEAAPVTKIICLDKPVPQRYSPKDAETLWLLISQLSVNYFGLKGPKSLDILKETLRLYGYGQATDIIEELKSVTTTPVTRRIGSEAWRGFVQGLQVELEFSSQSGDSGFLLACVLRHYFALTVSINSFVELAFRRSDSPTERIRWLPLPGERILL